MKRVVGLVLMCATYVAQALPDLQVTQTSHFATGCLTRGQSYHGSGVIKNVGDTTAKNFRVLIVMYGEESYFDVTSLASGETETLEVDRVLPSDAPCQRYGIRVIVDVDNSVTETSEGADNAKNGLSYFPCDCPDAAPSSTPTSTAGGTETYTPTLTELPSSTPSPTGTATEVEVSATNTPTQTQTIEPTATQSATLWPTPSPSATVTETQTEEPTCTNTGEPTATITKTPVATKTVTSTKTETNTKTATATKTYTSEHTATRTETSVPTATDTYVPTATQTTIPPTVTHTATATATGTQTGKPDLSAWYELLSDNLEELPEGSCLADWTIYTLRVHVKNTGTVSVENVQVFANLFGKDYEDILDGSLATGEEKVWTIKSDPFHPVCNGGYGTVIEIDPENLIDENDETNNRISKYLLKGCCPEETATATVSPTITATETFSPTLTATATLTQTDLPTATPTNTLSPTATRTATLWPTPSPTVTATSTRTNTLSPTATRTKTSVPTATKTGVPPTATPTATEEQFCDRGFYTLSVSGSLHKAGNPPKMNSNSLFGAMAMDAEKVRGNEDIAIIDGSGVATFVNDPAGTPMQDFLFETSPNFPLGRAVDLTMTPSGEGFWVLTDFGGIYRAGTAMVVGQDALVPNTDQLPIGYDIPFGTIRRAGFPNPGNTSLRAVALAVVNPNCDDSAEGYIILDSQGGRFLLDADGTTVPSGTYAGYPDDDPLKLLDPMYVWPFFPGLDIARDIELHPTQQGLVVFDGWGGIHPVPVDRPSNPVFFTRNEDPNNPGTLITTVGMPYITIGFDDPATPEDEGDANTYGADAESIFTEFDFSPGCPQGFYTLDKFGGVFTFGGARKSPDSCGAAWPNTYFFPYMYGKKLIVY